MCHVHKPGKRYLSKFFPTFKVKGFIFIRPKSCFMIQLQNVSKIFKAGKAVDNISIEVAEGETLVLLGTSGCGKTTTLRMINRLEEATSGEIFVNGKDIKSQQPEMLRRSMGYVLQHHGLFPHYTVSENIAIVPSLLKWSKDKIENRIHELLLKLQLPQAVANSYPHQLSGGQQQRVGLARALAANPPILLMDEPFGALDPITRTSVRKELNQLDELKTKTVVMVTHDVQEAFEMGDQICLMNQGKIIQTGTASELLFHPANEFVSSFLSEQRFRLELENIRISDVLDYLPKAIAKTNEVNISTKTTLWQLLENFDKQSAQAINYVAGNDDGIKQIDSAKVMAAFSQYKKNLYHE